MLQQENSFYVTLFSNGSLDFYPKNTLSKFTVKLPFTVELSNNENWSVGLYSASLPDFKYEPIQKVFVKVNNKDYTSFINTPASIITLISCSEIFFKSIQNEVENNTFFQKFEKVEYKKIQIDKTNKIDKSKYIAISFTNDLDIYLEHSINYSMISLFNFVYSQIPKNKRTEVNIKFQNDLKSENLRNSQLFGNDAFQEIIVNSSHKIFFYLDLIKPQILNSTTARTLYIRPIKNSMEDNKEFTVQNIQYCSLDKFHINDISVLITDEHGEQINFKEGTHYTCIVLHFHKSI